MANTIIGYLRGPDIGIWGGVKKQSYGHENFIENRPSLIQYGCLQFSAHYL